MKKLMLLFTLLLVLSGCSAKYQVETVDNLEFGFSQMEESYSLSFSLRDKEGNSLAVPAEVSLHIEDQKGNVLFDGEKKITEENYETEHSPVSGDRFKAQVILGREELTEGLTSSGTVTVKIKNGLAFSFKDLSCEADFCLPLKVCSFQYGELGQEILLEDPFWHSTSKYKITALTPIMDPYTEGNVNLLVEGVKTQGKAGGMDQIRYRVSDSQGNSAGGGELYLGKYDDGDAFGAEILLYGLVPGESYQISFSGN